MARMHRDRVALAQEIATALLARYGPERVLSIGLHGSVARGDDDAASDLDLAVITSNAEIRVPARVCRMHGVIVDLGAISAADYLAEAERIGPQWPVASDQYTVTLPLHDPGGFFGALRVAHERAMARATDEPFLRAAALTYLQALDAVQGAERHAARGEGAAMHTQMQDALAGCALTLGLLLRRTAANLPRLIQSVARNEWDVPDVARPFDIAAHEAPASVAMAALIEAIGALGLRCNAHGVVWEVSSIEQLLVDGSDG